MSAAPRLTGRVGVVAEAGCELGREIALALAAEGMHLALLSRTGARVRDLAVQIDSRHDLPSLPFAVDVRDAAAVDRVVAHVEQQLGPVDLLVDDAAGVTPSQLRTGAGSQHGSRAAAGSGRYGGSALCRSLLPAMVARRHGHVVNVAARGRTAAAAGARTPSGASQHAPSSLAASLAGQLIGTGVVVVDVLPGPTLRTGPTASAPVSDVPEGGWMPASVTAAVVADAAAGRYDDRCGQVLDAAALGRTEGAARSTP